MGVSASMTCRTGVRLIPYGARAHTKGAKLKLSLSVETNENGTLTFSSKDVSVDLGNFHVDMDGPILNLLKNILDFFALEKIPIQNAITGILGDLADQVNSFVN